MSKVVINSVEYETETMSDQAKSLLGSLKVLDGYLTKLNNEIKIFNTAKQSYLSLLLNELDNDTTTEKTKDEKKLTAKKQQRSTKSKKTKNN